MLNILVDTCVWLDMAKDSEQRPLLGVIQELIDLGEVRLIVPRIVLTEFARNRARIVEESGRSMGSVFKRVKEAVEKFGDPNKAQEVLDQLNDVDHRIPLLGGSVNASIGQIERLLTSVPVIELTDSVKARAAQRAIDKIAPFHRQRNGIDDAILIEIYADQSTDPALKGQRFAFVSHNTKDFSDPIGNNKAPHPDLASLFTKIKSRYFIKLSEAVQSVRSDLVSELMVEHEGWVEEPRKLSEIVEAIGELLDKVWYNRHKVTAEKIANGTIQLVDKETFPVKDHARRPIQNDIWAGALKSAKRVEQQYGIAEMGPWTDFEWGMLNGKLSALRWVLGDEWDMLDT